jgi:hypothetical protein
MNDPGSLQNLNDIVLPAPVEWWPLAPGWYVVFVVLACIFCWILFRRLKAWRRNTYRREALRELSEICSQGSIAARRLPGLLKRTALSAWPREQVAELSGAPWHDFLDRTGDTADFGTGMGKVLDRLSYAGSGEPTLSGAEFEQACEATEAWIRRHRQEDC